MKHRLQILLGVKVRVCKLQLNNYNGPLVFELTQERHVQGVLEEVRSLLSEDDDPQITLTVEEMSRVEFESLGEFQGY